SSIPRESWRGSVAMIRLLMRLVLLTTSASAECAWVPWGSGIQQGRPIPAFAVDSFTTLRECKEAANRLAKPRDPKTGDLTNGSCRPDTVDPRGPKGK